MVKVDFNTPGTIMTLIIFGILGYFVYDKSIESAIGIMGIAIVVNIVGLLSLLPIMGWIISTIILYFVIIPGLLTITGLEHTWLITVIFASNVIIGFIVTIAMSIIMIKIFDRRQNVQR